MAGTPTIEVFVAGAIHGAEAQLGRPLTVLEVDALLTRVLTLGRGGAQIAGAEGAGPVVSGSTTGGRSALPPGRFTRGPCKLPTIPRGDRCRRCGFPLAAHPQRAARRYFPEGD